MLNYKPILVEELSKLEFPVYYELFFDSTTQLPCLTYIEVNDYSHKEGDTLRYSRKKYRLKIWGKDLAQMSNYFSLLDIKMKELGFRRTNYNELWYDDVCSFIIDYEGMALEDLN